MLQQLDAFNALVARYQHAVRVMCVYIQEAHAVDTWPFGLPQEYRTTHTIEERCAVANDFIRNERFEHALMIDVPPAAKFNALFAAWPLRFYVLEPRENGAGLLTFIAEPDGDQMSVGFIGRYLARRFPDDA